MMRVAVLDDWQDAAKSYADWGRLETRAQVDFFNEPIAPEALVSTLQDYDIILTVQDRTKLPATVIDKLPKLRMIGITVANPALDVEACGARGIVVSKTDGALGQGGWAAAELTLGLLIAGARHFPDAFANMRSGKFQEGLPVGRTLAGRTLGIIGFGRLGRRLASYAVPMGMTVLAWSPNIDGEQAASLGVGVVGKEELLKRADAVSIHVKLTDSSRGLISGKEIALMREGALLINTSRGPIIDEAALVDAVKAGSIHVALDVFDDEPLPPHHPLRHAKNATLTPHLGFVVEEAWKRFYQQSVENVLAFLDGAPVRRVV